ncbi:hypothetical protein BB559_001076 [Furculomyces boomerangus]|uniref:polynucleotide adenylyltransferase n=2 Tax=Harpellales TaxID=61421 RepID=A0A2T9Z370_9FUNG|nr:hypothetical protein BB559_001076 [Furculomyces boomerangus]PWA00324.1 hypothetical protein BB558_003634 [Smittium angustum]
MRFIRTKDLIKQIGIFHKHGSGPHEKIPLGIKSQDVLMRYEHEFGPKKNLKYDSNLDPLKNKKENIETRTLKLDWEGELVNRDWKRYNFTFKEMTDGLKAAFNKAIEEHPEKIFIDEDLYNINDKIFAVKDLALRALTYTTPRSLPKRKKVTLTQKKIYIPLALLGDYFRQVNPEFNKIGLKLSDIINQTREETGFSTLDVMFFTVRDFSTYHTYVSNENWDPKPKDNETVIKQNSGEKVDIKNSAILTELSRITENDVSLADQNQPDTIGTLNRDINKMVEESAVFAETQVNLSDIKAKIIKATKTIYLHLVDEPKCVVYGSYSLGLVTKESNINISVLFRPYEKSKHILDKKNFLSLFMKQLRHLKLVGNTQYSKTPLARLKHQWLGKIISIDVSSNNYEDISKTNLVRSYMIADPRVRPLLLMVKIWANNRELVDTGKLINTWGYTLLMLAYLVEKKVVPNLQSICCLSSSQKPSLESTDSEHTSLDISKNEGEKFHKDKGSNENKSHISNKKETGARLMKIPDQIISRGSIDKIVTERLLEIVSERYHKDPTVYDDDYIDRKLFARNEEGDQLPIKKFLVSTCTNCKKQIFARDKKQKAWYFYHAQEQIISENKESVGELLMGFFHYYGYEHNYLEDVVSLRLGSTKVPRTKCKHMDRSAAGKLIENPKSWKHLLRLLSIEDPMMPEINIGRNIPPWSVEGIRAEMRRAHYILESGQGLLEAIRLYRRDKEFSTEFWEQECDITLPVYRNLKKRSNK